MDNLPEGPRGLLFKQLLPEVQPLISVIDAIAEERKKTPSQVNRGPLTVHDDAVACLSRAQASSGLHACTLALVMFMAHWSGVPETVVVVVVVVVALEFVRMEASVRR